MPARSRTRGRKPRTPRSIDRAPSVILPVLRSGGRGNSPATRPELNYERLASRHQHVPVDTQRLQATTTRSQSRQAARVWQQNRMVCALRPSLVSMVTGCGPGGHAARPGCSRRPYSLAEPGNSRSRAVSVPPVSVPARSVTGWPDQGGERGPGHSRARHAQPRGQDGAGHCRNGSTAAKVMVSSQSRAAQTCSCISAPSPVAADAPPGTTPAPPGITAANGWYAAKGR